MDARYRVSFRPNLNPGDGEVLGIGNRHLLSQSANTDVFISALWVDLDSFGVVFTIARIDGNSSEISGELDDFFGFPLGGHVLYFLRESLALLEGIRQTVKSFGRKPPSLVQFFKRDPALVGRGSELNNHHRCFVDVPRGFLQQLQISLLLSENFLLSLACCFGEP
jgi:hypothetical protein